jgi:predicted RNA binding protein YcfA (HicA-like mRNA interferase family)
MGQVFSSRELMAMITADGWYLAKITGDHHHFKHPTKPGKVTIPHPKRDVAKGTANSILRQAGLK